jgi:hypothetical protein
VEIETVGGEKTRVKETVKKKKKRIKKICNIKRRKEIKKDRERKITRIKGEKPEDGQHERGAEDGKVKVERIISRYFLF